MEGKGNKSPRRIERFLKKRSITVEWAEVANKCGPSLLNEGGWVVG